MADYWNDDGNKNNNSSQNGRYTDAQNNQNGGEQNSGFDSRENFDSNHNTFSVPSKNERPKTQGWSVASMVLGILSVVCCCCFFPIGGVVFAVAAIVLSAVSCQSLGYFDGMAIAGLILGIFGMIFSIMAIITVILTNGDFFKQFYEEFQKNMDQNGVEF